MRSQVAFQAGCPRISSGMLWHDEHEEAEILSLRSKKKTRSILPQRISRISVAWRGDAEFEVCKGPACFRGGIVTVFLVVFYTAPRPVGWLAGCLGPFPCGLWPRAAETLNSVNPHVMPPFLDR